MTVKTGEADLSMSAQHFHTGSEKPESAESKAEWQQAARGEEVGA